MFEHMSQPPIGTKDGVGSGDHDEPYTFGNHLSLSMHCPFNEIQFGHLIVLRGRVQDGLLTGDTEAA